MPYARVSRAELPSTATIFHSPGSPFVCAAVCDPWYAPAATWSGPVSTLTKASAQRSAALSIRTSCRGIMAYSRNDEGSPSRAYSSTGPNKAGTAPSFLAVSARYATVAGRRSRGPSDVLSSFGGAESGATMRTGLPSPMF